MFFSFCPHVLTLKPLEEWEVGRAGLPTTTSCFCEPAIPKPRPDNPSGGL